MFDRARRWELLDYVSIAFSLPSLEGDNMPALEYPLCGKSAQKYAVSSPPTSRAVDTRELQHVSSNKEPMALFVLAFYHSPRGLRLPQYITVSGNQRALSGRPLRPLKNWQEAR